MQLTWLTKVSTRIFFLIVSAALMLAVFALSAAAEHPPTTLATLLDRAQIEDLLVDYYGGLGAGRHDFGSYYADDGVLDVNSTVVQGKKAIEDLYKKAAQEPPAQKGTFRMLLTNLKIVVNGATATADLLWTGVNSETVKSVPQFIEQGREHDELVKLGGKWLFKKRVISSDGGLKGMFAKNYKPR